MRDYSTACFNNRTVFRRSPARSVPPPPPAAASAGAPKIRPPWAPMVVEEDEPVRPVAVVAPPPVVTPMVKAEATPKAPNRPAPLSGSSPIAPRESARIRSLGMGFRSTVRIPVRSV